MANKWRLGVMKTLKGDDIVYDDGYRYGRGRGKDELIIIKIIDCNHFFFLFYFNIIYISIFSSFTVEIALVCHEEIITGGRYIY